MGHGVSRVVWWMFCLGMVVCIAIPARAGEKKAVCHRSPGNPANFRIINIDASDVASHMAHGDHLVEPEVCDGVDNDCDGKVDDHVQLGTCTEGVGVCAMTDDFVCRDGQQVCTAIAEDPLEETEESCEDGLDNDCDGQADSADPDCTISPACLAPVRTWSIIPVPSGNSATEVPGSFTPVQCCMECEEASGCTFWVHISEDSRCFLTQQRGATEPGQCPLGVQTISYSEGPEVWNTGPCGVPDH